MEGMIRSLARKFSYGDTGRFEDLCQEGRYAEYLLNQNQTLSFESDALRDRYYINTIVQRMLDYLRRDQVIRAPRGSKRLKRVALDELSLGTMQSLIGKELEFWDSVKTITRNTNELLAIQLALEGQTVLTITEMTGLHHRGISLLLHKALRVTRD